MAKVVICDITFQFGGNPPAQLTFNCMAVPDYYETFTILNAGQSLNNPPLANGPAALNRFLIDAVKIFVTGQTGAIVNDSDIIFQPFTNIQ
jgi:hypothetical protein